MINSEPIPLRLPLSAPKRVNRLSSNELMLFGNFRFATIAKSILNPKLFTSETGWGHPCSLISFTSLKNEADATRLYQSIFETADGNLVPQSLIITKIGRMPLQRAAQSLYLNRSTIPRRLVQNI